MTKKREPTTAGAAERKVTKKAGGEPTRGTAAGLRKGASTATAAKEATSATGKKSQKELTKRGGPGRAGTSGTSVTKKAAPRKKTATRGRGTKAKAGA